MEVHIQHVDKIEAVEVHAEWEVDDLIQAASEVLGIEREFMHLVMEDGEELREGPLSEVSQMVCGCRVVAVVDETVEGRMLLDTSDDVEADLNTAIAEMRAGVVRYAARKGLVGERILLQCIEAWNTWALTILSQEGVDVSTILPCQAVNQLSAEQVTALSSLGCDFNKKEETLGVTQLMETSEAGRAALLHSLGADLDLRDRNGKTALFHFVERSRADLVEEILSLQCDPNIPSLFGTTPLMLACRLSQVDTTRCLLAHGADPTAVTRYKKTTLDFITHPHIRALIQEALPKKTFHTSLQDVFSYFGVVATAVAVVSAYAALLPRLLSIQWAV